MSASLAAASPDLAARRAALRAAEPRLYPRDLAARLGISEAELVALDEPAAATRLRPDWPALLAALGGLGEVTALTRNADAVHEKTGIYGKPAGGPQIALFTGEAIDLRLFLDHWAVAWAVEAAGRRSLQVFAADGTAAHKVYATARTDSAAWARLVADFAATLPPFAATPAPPAPPARPDAAIDLSGLRAAWDGLRDTHHFHALLARFAVTRLQAMRLAGADRARPVAPASLRAALEAAAANGLPIMVFVANPGCIQIHTGPIATLRATGPWFNILDPGFNLHLRETAIDSAWVVRKPTDDGIVTALELFDAQGGLIATLFGARKPGHKELDGWRTLCSSLAAA